METKGRLTRASQIRLARIVTIDELYIGAGLFGDARREWEQKMITKYGLKVK